MKRIAWVALFALACAAPIPPAAERSQVPDRSPDIRGEVTNVQDNTVFVEATPGERRGAKAVVTVSSTSSVSRGGKRVSASDIRVGDTVSVWFDGAVAQSYPLQANASVVAID